MSDAEKPQSNSKKKKPKSSMRKVSAFLVGLVVVGVFAASGVSYWLAKNFTRSWVLTEEKIVNIPRGSGVAAIAQLLKEQGVINNPLAFRIVLRFNKLDKSLKAGEYLFPARVTPKQVARILEEGKTVLYRVTFPEGLTSLEMMTMLEKEDALTGSVSEIPPEGSLLPETYSYHRGMTRQTVVDHMQDSMQATLDELWEKRQPDLPFKTKREALILASIVEKETAISAERAKVAGVFVNRLRKGMRLQTDPTVAYGLTLGKETLGRPLTRKDLKNPTPYNTYTINGLPPGPICNPGRASIQAVLDPMKTDALYFVADGSGGHAFAETLREHNRNVAKWRKYKRNNP